MFTVGDDIAWLHPGEDGRLWAINPEAGYFGVVPGTNPETNRNAYDMIRRDTLFTNVALTADNQPWWEGLESGTPVIDWQGRPYDPANGPAAHPNSRFTVSAQRNPSYSPHAEDARGVPISAIVFGGRRREVAPLVYEARDWQHGVLVGASVASETTAAAVGQVGVIRRDPMAMQPFCGYNFGDYWQHWLNVGAKLTRPPAHLSTSTGSAAIAQGKFLWPGYGENLRVLAWMLERCAGRAGAVRHADRTPAAARGSEHAGTESGAGGAAGAAGGGSAAVAQGSRGNPRVPGQVRRAPAPGAAAGTRQHRTAPGLTGRAGRRRPSFLAGEADRLRRALLGQPPESDHALPLICRLSRRTNASSPSAVCTNVPLVLWSMSTNLLRLISMRACSREIRLPLTTTSLSSARPMVMLEWRSSSTSSRSWQRRRRRMVPGRTRPRWRSPAPCW